MYPTGPSGPRVDRRASVIVASAADRAPGGTEQREDRPNYHQDDPETPQNRNMEQVSHHQEDNTENDHDASCEPRLRLQ
jgi:hypothetical protein